MHKVRSLSAEDLGVTPESPRAMTDREEATVIAALRLWQNVQDGRLRLVVGSSNQVLPLPEGAPVGLDHFEDITTNAGEFDPLDIDGIDVLLADIFAVD